MTVSDFLALRWSSPGAPLIQPPRFSPVIADPTFLFPEETPDGAWCLVAHSAWGLHRYDSADGERWEDRGLIVPHAMRPFLRRIGGEFFLFYEAYPPFALPLTALPLKRRWRSELRLSRSPDLRRWSPGERVLAAALPWMRDAALGDSVSNPCLVPSPRGWDLYFSASLSWIPDCGFCEPRYIGRAAGTAPEGPFAPEPAPLIDPADDALPGVLGAGSMKVLPLEDGLVGLQNKIYRDRDGRSRSAIFVLSSMDGLAWGPAAAEPLVAPATGWTSSHVYACDCRFRPADGRWHLYFNARDGWRISEGRERIGRIVGAGS